MGAEESAPILTSLTAPEAEHTNWLPCGLTTGAATATLSGGSLTIAGVAAGSASVSVRDAVGSSVTIAVTVPAQALQESLAAYLNE